MNANEHEREWRHDADGYAYKRYMDAAGQPRRQYADKHYLNALEARAAAAERDLAEAKRALERIANDENSMACSDVPYCQMIGPHGHAEDCAVGIARAFLARLSSQEAPVVEGQV